MYGKKYDKIFKLLFDKPFEKKVTLNQLWKIGVIGVGKGPRPLTKISKEDYEKILKLSVGNNDDGI